MSILKLKSSNYFTMKKLGLIGGSTISKYSIAPALWHSMVALPLEYKVIAAHCAKDVVKVLNDRSFLGFNVAKPFKQHVCTLVTPDDEITKKLGICNTVYRKKGKLRGANTDGYGCLDAMKLAGFEPKKSETLILGCGGAGAALAFVLIKNGGKVWIFDLDVQKITSFLSKLGKKRDKVRLWNKHKLNFDAVVNATPAGIKMVDTKNHLRVPLSKSFLKRLSVSFFVEMNYNPFKTIFLKIGEKQGAIIIPGVYMLYFQARRAAEKFGLRLYIREVDEVVRDMNSILR